MISHRYSIRHWISDDIQIQLWSFISYNWLFLWDYTFYKCCFLSKYWDYFYVISMLFQWDEKHSINGVFLISLVIMWL